MNIQLTLDSCSTNLSSRIGISVANTQKLMSLRTLPFVTKLVFSTVCGANTAYEDIAYVFV